MNIFSHTDKPKQQQEQQQQQPREDGTTNTGGSNSSPRSNKITDRMNKAVEDATTVGETKHRSADLTPLTAEYEQLKHKLRTLVSLTKKYQEQNKHINDARFQLVEQLALMSEKSPIDDEVGNDVDEETSKDLKRLRDRSTPTSTEEVKDLTEMCDNRTGSASDDPLSLYGLTGFWNAQGVANDNEFTTHVIDYVVNWEHIVTERVEADLKKVKKLEGDRRHYEGKVEGLREKVNAYEASDKETPKAKAEKLERNEEKLKEAFNSHEREAGKLCALLEAVTHDGYKDLYPLVKNYMKWEINRIGRDHDIAERMSVTLDSLNKKIGSKTRRSNSSSTNNNDKTSTTDVAGEEESSEPVTSAEQ